MSSVTSNSEQFDERIPNPLGSLDHNVGDTHGNNEQSTGGEQTHHNKNANDREASLTLTAKQLEEGYGTIILRNLIEMKRMRRCGLRAVNRFKVAKMCNELNAVERPNDIIGMWMASNPVIAMTNCKKSGFNSAFNVDPATVQLCSQKSEEALLNTRCLLLEGNHRLAATELVRAHLSYSILDSPINVKVIVVPPCDDESLERTLCAPPTAAGCLPTFSRACARLSHEMERNALFNKENERRTYWEMVMHCRMITIPHLRSSIPKIANRNLKSQAVIQGLVPSAKGGSVKEPWHWAMDINYVFPDTLFNLVKDTIFASENESDSERRKQTLNKVAITDIVNSWNLNEQVVKDALAEMKSLNEWYPADKYNEILQDCFKAHFDQYLRDSNHSRIHIEEVTNHVEKLFRLRSNDQIKSRKRRQQAAAAQSTPTASAPIQNLRCKPQSSVLHPRKSARRSTKTVDDCAGNDNGKGNSCTAQTIDQKDAQQLENDLNVAAVSQYDGEIITTRKLITNEESKSARESIWKEFPETNKHIVIVLKAKTFDRLHVSGVDENSLAYRILRALGIIFVIDSMGDDGCGTPCNFLAHIDGTLALPFMTLGPNSKVQFSTMYAHWRLIERYRGTTTNNVGGIPSSENIRECFKLLGLRTLFMKGYYRDGIISVP